MLARKASNNLTALRALIKALTLLFIVALALAFVVPPQVLAAGGDWTQQSPAAKPSARYRSDMAYIGGDHVLLFGGYDSFYDDETWVYDLSANTWTQQSPAAKPSARSSHAMAYIGGDQVLLFGGDDGTFDDETWVYDLSANTWTQKSPAAKLQTCWILFRDIQFLRYGLEEISLRLHG